MRRGLLYNPMDQRLAQARLRSQRLSYQFSSSIESEDIPILQSSLRTLLSSKQDCIITPPFQSDYGFNIHLEGVYCNSRCTFLDCGLIIVGKGTMFGPNVDVYTVSHPTDPIERGTLVEFTVPVIIGKNCWIGGKATILPGVRIGDNAVIGAGSVVTKDVPDNWVVAGNPAKFIRRVLN